jgi:DNA replication protein DnaC
MTTICPICEDSGLRLIVQPDGERYAQPCECRLQLQAARLLKRAAIPKRYEHCTLDSFEPGYGQADQSLAAAHMMARNFVSGYPVTTEGAGFCSPETWASARPTWRWDRPGVDLEKGVRGLFCDYRELLKRIQESYNPLVATTELQILAPVFEAEVLILDELGAQKPTDWVWDTVALILNTRYNDKRTTLITTNYPNAPAALARERRTKRCAKRRWATASASACARAWRKCAWKSRCAATTSAKRSRRPVSAEAGG